MWSLGLKSSKGRDFMSSQGMERRNFRGFKGPIALRISTVTAVIGAIDIL